MTHSQQSVSSMNIIVTSDVSLNSEPMLKYSVVEGASLVLCVGGPPDASLA